jgi:hypothetical protein
MKRKSKLKKWLIAALCLVLVAALGLGIWFGVKGRNTEPVAVFPFMYVGMSEYWGDSQESYGFVESEGVQTVYLSGTQTITEVMVELGQEVKKGDVILSFDTTLSDLALERKRLGVEKLKLQLEDAKKRLAEINAMRPMVIPQPSDEPEEDVDLGELLTDTYKLSHDPVYDGKTAETPLICWLNSATSISDEILNAIRDKALEYQIQNSEKEPEIEEEPEVLQEDGTEPSKPENPSEPVDPSEPSEPTEPEEEEITANRLYVVFKVTENNYALGIKTAWQGIYLLRSEETGEFSFKFFDAGLVPDHMLAPDEEAEEEPEIDYGSGFTAAQIAEMRQQQEKTIKDLEFNIKMAETEYKIAQTEVADGNVYAQIDGVVVSLLSPDEAEMMQMPLVKISAGGGFYVEGTVGELDRDTMVIGQEVTINDWYTGMNYVGHVESLGDYPSAEDSWNGMGNPTSSYYPFRVFVDESADLQTGNYVSIIFSAGTNEQGVYLENPFLRTENGISYVYVRGEDGTLEKRQVVTGKSLWGSYTQILEGLTEEDFIAFPYGKNIKPGAPTEESDLSALYG